VNARDLPKRLEAFYGEGQIVASLEFISCLGE
jgi:hypothetical protein